MLSTFCQFSTSLDYSHHRKRPTQCSGNGESSGAVARDTLIVKLNACLDSGGRWGAPRRFTTCPHHPTDSRCPGSAHRRRPSTGPVQEPQGGLPGRGVLCAETCQTHLMCREHREQRCRSQGQEGRRRLSAQLNVWGSSWEREDKKSPSWCEALQAPVRGLPYLIGSWQTPSTWSTSPSHCCSPEWKQSGSFSGECRDLKPQGIKQHTHPHWSSMKKFE